MNIKTIPEANYLDGIQWNGGVEPLPEVEAYLTTDKNHK